VLKSRQPVWPFLRAEAWAIRARLGDARRVNNPFYNKRDRKYKKNKILKY
jgi:hypothetical protein